MAPQRTDRSRQKGGVSVELALIAPILVLLIIGGVHFGVVLTTRHQLTNATNHATRAAAVGGVTNAGQIRNLILDQLGGSADRCADLVVIASTGNVFGQGELRVEARCILDTGIGGNLLGAVGPDQLTITAAMPF